MNLKLKTTTVISILIISILILSIAVEPVYSIDSRISAPFEGILLFIYGFGMIQFITRRGAKSME